MIGAGAAVAAPGVVPELAAPLAGEAGDAGDAGVDPRGRDSIAFESIDPLRTGADWAPATSGVWRGADALGAACAAGRGEVAPAAAGAVAVGEPGDVRDTIGAGGPLAQAARRLTITAASAPRRR